MLTAKDAVIAELTAENAAMLVLITEMFAAEQPIIQGLIDAGHTPNLAMFPFTDRLRAFVQA